MATVKYSGSMASFHCPTSAQIKSLKVYFSPIQQGSGDPSLNNIRNIKGWDEVQVQISSIQGQTTLQEQTINYSLEGLRLNKFNWNVSQQNPDNTTNDASVKRLFTPYTYSVGFAFSNYFNPSKITSYSINNGTISLTTTAIGYGIGFAIPVQELTDYIMSGTLTGGAGIYVSYFSEDGTFLGSQNNIMGASQGGKITTLEGTTTAIVLLTMVSSSNLSGTFSNLQLELGSTATPYTPYDETTVLGGWVDLITGQVWKTIQSKKITEASKYGTWNSSTGGSFLYITAQMLQTANDGVLCNRIKLVDSIGTSTKTSGLVWRTDGIIRWVDVEAMDLTTAEYKNYLIEHPLQLTYKLTNPVFVGNVEPIQLSTYLGQNNIWSNADYVEVEYDLHETQNILARKQFIIANQPHIATLPAASFQHLTTSVPALIKDCKIYFSPIQTGEGTPSPDNIMPIIGHDVIKLHRSGKNVFDMNCFNTGQVTVENGIATGTGTNFNKTFNSPYYIPLDIDLSTSRWSMSMTAYTEGNSSTADKSGLMIGMIYTDETNKKVYFNNQNTSPVTLTLTNAEDKILEGFRMSYAFSGGNIWHVTGVQLEYGATVSQYEPYNGITIPITLPSTLYGSTINLTTGEITQNYQLFSFDGTENWETAVFSTPGPSSRIMIWLDTISGHNNYDQHKNRPIYCSHFSYGGTASTTFGEYRYNPVSGSPPRAYFAIMDPNTEHFGSLANFKQFLADQAANNTPVQVLIPLTVPIHYQINPITLKTLRGINNIWSDVGNISLKYWTY